MRQKSAAAVTTARAPIVTPQNHRRRSQARTTSGATSNPIGSGFEYVAMPSRRAATRSVHRPPRPAPGFASLYNHRKYATNTTETLKISGIRKAPYTGRTEAPRNPVVIRSDASVDDRGARKR